MDMLSDAMLLVCDPAQKPWDPDRGTFTSHVMRVVADLAIERTRKGAGRFEQAHDGLTLDESTEHPLPHPEDLLQSKRELAWMREMAERTLDRAGRTYPFARSIFGLLSSGVDKPAELSAELGCPVDQVYSTIEAIKRHGRQVQEEWARSEGKRGRARGQEMTGREATR